MRPRGDRCQIKEVHAFDTHSVEAVDPSWSPSKAPLRVDGTVAKVLGVHGLLCFQWIESTLEWRVQVGTTRNQSPARERTIRRARQLTTCCQKR